MRPSHRLEVVLQCASRSFATQIPLAPSPRILAHLARRAGASIPSMALVEVPNPRSPPLEVKKAMEEPPSVMVTPCDPWPRPYYLENGLRRVAPYHYTYNTYCKERWRGRGLLDIFASEFRDRPLEYYKDAIERGNVVINGKPVPTLNHIVKNGDVISHTLHRHEPPVTALPISVLHEDDDMIVINKPSGVPVHPAGRYNYNSVVEIMRAERGHGWNPLPCNRLDRLTSGVMFIGKNPKAAEKLSLQIQGRTVRKEYIARVRGEFPDTEVVCDMPILQVSPKLGLNRVRANGKAARTVFKKLAYYPPVTKPVADEPASSETPIHEDNPKDEGYSIVRCLPVTGRTHQLRVHLQFLGHPIVNDPIYANRRVWGTNLGANDGDGSQDTDEDIITRLSRMGKSEVADAVAYHDEMVDQYEKKKAEKMSGELCELCQTPLYTDPGEQELSLWLHSLRYEDAGGAWSYVSPLPAWAMPPDGVDGPTEVGGMEALVEAVKEENPEIA
ncbi:Pseudouridine synthase [Venustampulla echinocandica]|uniref:Pseudouridine synthase n=1 Tax=Venustampulla echinocandica TaxID=2656787 RepID=A0A370TPR9_9HELO|nr:Pseudouridine synthase [Venustampulla echinocandica]RDL37513.1 Pseudouridine synthase [Venustampulla echinocandica]